MGHRSLYPNASGFGTDEERVYRSVTLESPQLGGSFDPLSHFDSFAHHHDNKQLSMNPKSAYGYASYQPTLNFDIVVRESKAQPTATVAAISTPVLPTSVAVPPPPQAPAWLEPNSHFFCSCPPPTTPSTLYDTVHATLQSLHEGNSASAICTLDCTPTPTRYKLSCTAYQRHSGAATPFIVRIFAADVDSHKYCVEFQRRQGDVVHFYELFRTARTRIQAAHPCDDAEQAPVAEADSALSMQSLDAALAIPQLQLRSWAAPSLPVEETGTGSFAKEHICETVRSLLQMCASPCIDIKLQGTLALAELTCSPSFDDAMKNSQFNLHETLIAEGCFQLFLDCLPIEEEGLHRASLMALANLMETQSHLCAQVVRDEKSLARLYALTSSNANQVVRECARILSACATKLGPELLSTLPATHKPQFHQTIQRLSAHTDAHCRQHANTIQTAIHV